MNNVAFQVSNEEAVRALIAKPLRDFDISIALTKTDCKDIADEDFDRRLKIIAEQRETFRKFVEGK